MDLDQALSQPFFSKIAQEGALLKNFHAITHPSQPNYIALTSGDTHGVKDDGNHDLEVRHLGDLLEEKRKTWKNYAENYPGNCFLESQSQLYVRKHTPFLSYMNVQSSDRCDRIVNAAEFKKDLKKGKLPDFSFYTPNMIHDGHDSDASTADRWFKKTFGPLLNDAQFKDVLLIVTFDENSCNTIGPHGTKAKLAKCKGDPNLIYTAFYGGMVKPGATSNGEYNHYHLLRTIENGLGLGTLGLQDEAATAITDIWK
jgi:hypothetical protein